MAGFAGAAAVITGGASGIGRATARAFVEAGAHAVIVDRDAPLADEAAAALSEATAVQADVSVEADCRRAASRAAELGRPVRWLVNCAASFLLKGEDATTASWEHSLGVNVRGSALMASAVLPLIRAAGGGAIVNVASISGYIAQPRHWTYGASKGAVLALTRCQMGHDRFGRST